MSVSYGTSAGKEYWDLRGKSTDTKPVDDSIPNGSSYFETDTGEVYVFDIDTKTWLLQ